MKKFDYKIHDVYNDKFVLNVVSLNCTELATREDIESGLVRLREALSKYE